MLREVVMTFVGDEHVDGLGDGVTEAVDSAGRDGRKEGVEIEESKSDRIKICTVGRQEAQLDPGAFDGSAKGGRFMGAYWCRTTNERTMPSSERSIPKA